MLRGPIRSRQPSRKTAVATQLRPAWRPDQPTRGSVTRAARNGEGYPNKVAGTAQFPSIKPPPGGHWAAGSCIARSDLQMHQLPASPPSGRTRFLRSPTVRLNSAEIDATVTKAVLDWVVNSPWRPFAKRPLLPEIGEAFLVLTMRAQRSFGHGGKTGPRKLALARQAGNS